MEKVVQVADVKAFTNVYPEGRAASGGGGDGRRRGGRPDRRGRMADGGGGEDLKPFKELVAEDIRDGDS